MAIHSTAVVDKEAHLGKDVDVGAFVVIHGGASIEDGCRLDAHTVIYGGTTLGRGCRVHAGAVIGDTPQDLGFAGVESFVRVGAGCTLREGVTIHRGTKEGTTTEVGDECYLMAFSHLAHNCSLGEKVIMANGVLLAGYVEIGSGAFLSGHVVVHQFCRIGRLAMVGGAGAISQDVPPFCTTHTLALNQLVGLNVVGLRRAGFSPDERKDIKAAYKTLFVSGRKMSDAVAEVRAAHTQGPSLELCDFIEASERGVCRPAARED